MAGTLFANVRIIDGSGAEPFTGHVLVADVAGRTADRVSFGSSAIVDACGTLL